MKANYFLRSAFLLAGISCTTVFAQVKQPNLSEVTKPVQVNGVAEDFPFLYEVASAWGDYDNDGYQDLILAGVGANGETTVLYKNENGKFTKVAHPFPALKQSSATWFDYNNDGNLDLFLTGWDGTSRYSGLWKNKGAAGNYEFEEVLKGSFVAINNGGGNRSNRYVIAGDYNNDGWIDLYMQGQTTDDKNSRISYLYKNINGERFELVTKPIKNKTNSEKPFIQLAGGSAAWADYDGDGYLDLVVAGEAIDADKYDADYGYHGSYNGAVYKNNGNGTFAEPIEFLGGEEGDVCWIDYNNDGKLDYTVTGVAWDQDWQWLGNVFMNEGATFTKKDASKTGLPNNKQSLSTTVGDVNNDGLEDILYMNAPDADAIYLNNGTTESIMFTKQPLVYNAPNNSQRGGTANLIDFDNDGNLDAFLIGYGDGAGSHARLMKNNLGNGIATNKAPDAPANLKVLSGSNGIVMFSWDAPADDHTPAKALRYNLYIKQGNVVKMTLPADIQTGRLKVEETSAAIKRTTLYKVSGLEGEYTWGVQAIDNAKQGSKFATFGTSGIDNEKVNASVSIVNKDNSIEINAENANLTGIILVYGINGANIHSKSGQIDGTVLNLTKGIYVVKVVSTEGTIVEKVIIK